MLQLRPDDGRTLWSVIRFVNSLPLPIFSSFSPRPTSLRASRLAVRQTDVFADSRKRQGIVTLPDFEIERVETVYSVHDKNRGKKAGELIIIGPFKPSASAGLRSEQRREVSPRIRWCPVSGRQSVRTAKWILTVPVVKRSGRAAFGQLSRRPARLPRRGRQDDHLRADGGTVVKIDDVLVQQANAA